MSELKSSIPEISAIDVAAAAAARAFGAWCFSPLAQRAELLSQLALRLEQDRASLIRTAMQETSLGEQRLQGEFARTIYQLKGFAERLGDKLLIREVEEPAVPGAPPQGHPRLQRKLIGIGPVAMFAASNFPFAFSVLGGDTVSALAAGCPVVVKAHPGHPRLSLEVYRVAQDVLASRPEWADLIQMVEGDSHELGAALVRHEDIAAVAFTGSFAGGNALQRLASNRARPIPFYGELGSINPIVILPPALHQHDAVAQELAVSIAASSGQMCTSPGVLLLLDCPRSREFLVRLRQTLQDQPTHDMLTGMIRDNFERGIAHWRAIADVAIGANATDESESAGPTPTLGVTSAHAFIEKRALREEVFGPACLAVLCTNTAQMHAALAAIGGSLTATLWGLDEEDAEHRSLIQRAMSIAGRVLFAGVPTGVAVAEAQHHGGPWPSSTAAGFTSVGYCAVERFLRPVTLQAAPAWVDAGFRG